MSGGQILSFWGRSTDRIVQEIKWLEDNSVNIRGTNFALK